MSNFDECLAVILRHEGGYVDHPNDPGGATNMGITHKTLSEWRGVAVSKRDVEALSVAEAGAIYRANCWNAIRCDDLPAGVDLAVFDFGVNSGTSRSAKILQGLVGATVDGKIGPETIGKVSAVSAGHLVESICDQRLAFLKGLSIWPTFGTGWTRRVEETRAEALAMIDAGEAEKLDPISQFIAFILNLFKGKSA